MRILVLNRYLAFSIVLLFIFSPVARALSSAQTDIYNSGVYFFDAEGGGTNGGSCMIGSGTLPAAIPEPANGIFTAAATKSGVPAALVGAIYFIENNGKQGTDPSVYKWRDPPPPYGQGGPYGISSAQAKGPFQFLDGTWASQGQDGNGDGTKDVLDLTDAAFGAAHYLKTLLDQAHGNIKLAAGGYEAGHPVQSEYGDDAYALYQYFLAGATATGSTATSPCGDISVYKNPLRDVAQLSGSPGIDAGVDYSGEGPVYALGDAKIDVANPNSGWVGGNVVSYTLSSGPAAGKTVFVAENCTVAADIHEGQQITSDTIICNMHNAYPFIETGWAISGTSTPLAYWPDGAKCYYFSQDPANPIKTKTSTAYGTNFNDLMVKLGAPAAPTISPNITCTLPTDWPKW
jgi:hypothetical protein